MVGSTFVGTSISVGKTRQSKILCLGLSSELSFKGVLVTQELLRIFFRVKEIYNWASHLFPNLFLLSLILTGPQKSPTLFDSLEKNSNFWSKPR